MNLPNKLTVLRLILSVVIIILLVFPFYAVGIQFPTFNISGISSPVESQYFIAGIIFIIAIWISCHLGKYSKFYILKTFVNTLKESNGDDALLASKGGINKIGLVLGILATPLVIIQAIFLISIIPGIIYGVLAPRIG